MKTKRPEVVAPIQVSKHRTIISNCIILHVPAKHIPLVKKFLAELLKENRRGHV